MSISLIDAGASERLERFGPYILRRPAPGALWRPRNPEAWKEAYATFSREDNRGWRGPHVPKGPWWVDVGGFEMRFKLTDFGHLGYFPEHAELWRWCQTKTKKGISVLNLFAYSGAASLALARAGASVCHVDSAPGMIEWGKENAAHNGIANIRWIVDDVRKFCMREVRRRQKYDAIILDPPSFGRGKQGQVFKIETDLVPLLEQLKLLLSDNPVFVVLSCHTPELSATVLKQIFKDGIGLEGEGGELVLQAESGALLPAGHYVRWAC